MKWHVPMVVEYTVPFGKRLILSKKLIEMARFPLHVYGAAHPGAVVEAAVVLGANDERVARKFQVTQSYTMDRAHLGLRSRRKDHRFLFGGAAFGTCGNRSIASPRRPRGSLPGAPGIPDTIVRPPCVLRAIAR